MRSRWLFLLLCAVLVSPNLVLAQTEWVEDPANPVIGPADPGTWDGADRYPLAVIEVEGVYHLYFNGHAVGSEFPFGYDIGHATSPDGVVWTMDPANPVLTRGAEGEWDATTLWGVALIHDESGFRMWFAGGNSDVVKAGYATSTDGSAWNKYEGNPIIDVGQPGAFDDIGVMPYTVIVQNGRYKMWYYSSKAVVGPDDWDWRVGYAESTDGLSWTKYPEAVFEPIGGWDGFLITAPSVIFDGSRYHMWYQGIAGGSVRIGYAVSPDGIEWVRYWGNPVIAISSGSQPEFPNVLYNEDTGSLEMWYRGFEDGGFHRATSDCCSTLFPLFLPAAAYAAGAEGSFYETDLDLSNAGSTDVEYRFAWLPRGERNTEPVESELFTLAAGRSVRYANVLAEVLDLEPGSFGALMIEASSQDLLAMARIANTPREEGEGSFGQAMAAVSLDDCTGQYQQRRLLFGTGNADMRFNVGCFNASDRAARVYLELFAADGTRVAVESLILMPWSSDQLNRIFDQYQPITGYVDVTPDTPGSRVYCFGSVLDNVSSDPMTIPPM